MAKSFKPETKEFSDADYPDHTTSHKPDIHVSVGPDPENGDKETIFHSCRECDYVKKIIK